MRLSAICLCLLLGFGCARTINRTAERRIRDALPIYVGRARVWRAHVDSAPERTVRGRLSRVTIDGEGVTLKGGFPLDQIHIEMDGVEVDTARQNLTAVRSTTFTAAIGEAGVSSYVHGLPRDADDPLRIGRIQMLDGHVRVEATRWLLGRAWPFTVIVEPRIVSGERLAFDPDRMTVEGIRVPLPAAVLRWLADRLDAGFALSSLPFPIHLTSFAVSPGRAVFGGAADVLGTLNEAISRQ